jgi:predicted AAA+ superfamily ATPase
LSNEKKFIKHKTPIVFIDEAQENEKIGAYVRQMKEDDGKVTQWILTGSSMTRLFKEDQRVPVGRIARYKLNPFSFIDFLTAYKKNSLKESILSFRNKRIISEYTHTELLKYCDLYLHVGGLPEAVMSASIEGAYRETIQQILLSQEDDFVRKNFLEKRHLFLAALRAVANNLGSSSHYSHISEKTYEAKEIVGMLERWHLINTVEQKGLATTTAFHPKRYLYDLGICQLLRSHPFPKISILNTLDKALRTPLGGLFENMVYLSLQASNLGSFEITSWKKNSKEAIEVDFILTNEKPIPIECKASLKITDSLTSLRSYLKLSGSKVGFVISVAPFKIIKEDNFHIINLPLYLARKDIILDLAKDY